jgi:predicted helicase
MPIMVVIGNPPYSVSSSNKGEHIEELMDSYKEAVRDERNIQPLSDDYIKFIRFAHDRVERTGYGVIGMITNHTYLSGLIHRGMREELLKTFDEIYVLNLHGNALKRETAPDGGKDENVFDIRQGVAIALMIKTGEGDELATVRYADLWGEREGKYQVLSENDVETLDWEPLEPVAPHYFWVPKDFDLQDEYEPGWGADDIFQSYSTGFETGRDSELIAFDREEIVCLFENLADPDISNSAIVSRYNIKDTSGWPVSRRRSDLMVEGVDERFVRLVSYRPFDKRFTYYHDFLRRAQFANLKHLCYPNIALITSRIIKGEDPRHVSVSTDPVEKIFLSSKTSNNAYIFPLYLYPDEDAATLFDETDTSPWEPDPAHGNRVPNLSKAFVDEFADKLGLVFDDHKTDNAPSDVFGPRDILAYIYAIFHSPTYRERYAEFLKIDFPRVPLTSDVDLFWHLVALGDELIQLHLMEHPKLDDTFTSFPVSGSDRVKRYGGFPKFIPAGESRTKTGDVAQKNRVYINLDQYFTGVPKDVWEFEVGGYQVLHKWLKDRKDRVLSYDEMEHYQKIVVALQETMRLMDEIDGAIPQWSIE